MKKIILGSLLLIGIIELAAQQEAASIDSLVTQYASSYKFSGSVLVSRKGKVLLEKGYGYCDTARQLPLSEKTIYNIASLTKSFTAALILKLQEAGRLHTDDKLNSYYPGYPNGDKITIYHLLTHSSGIFNYTDDKNFMSRDQTQAVQLQEMIALFKDKPLSFEPGTKFAYSNSGYTLLGYIIEKITGKPYSTVLTEMIFKPLGMKQTGYDFTNLQNVNKTTGYEYYVKEHYKQASYIHPSISYSTGAIYSTIGDMYKWHRAWQGGSFLSDTSVSMAYKKGVGNYGYGWSVDSIYGRQRISHSGNIPGFKANINRLPADDVCVIALGNVNSSETADMVRKITAILYHQPIPQLVVQPIVEVADSLRQQYVGIYQFTPTVTITVSIDGKQLKFEATGDKPYDLVGASTHTFRFKNADAAIEFIKDQEGRVAALYLYMKGQKTVCKKIK